MGGFCILTLKFLCFCAVAFLVFFSKLQKDHNIVFLVSQSTILQTWFKCFSKAI